MKYKSFLTAVENLKTGKDKLHNGHHVIGLCTFVEVKMYKKCNRVFKLLTPTNADIAELRLYRKATLYWGSGSISHKVGELTKLRETILLFCAALNNELK
jgi:hypothetical protein